MLRKTRLGPKGPANKPLYSVPFGGKATANASAFVGKRECPACTGAVPDNRSNYQELSLGSGLRQEVLAANGREQLLMIIFPARWFCPEKMDR